MGTRRRSMRGIRKLARVGGLLNWYHHAKRTREMLFLKRLL
jgi:hypothetical protein